MSEQVYRLTELVGSSEKSIEDAIATAIRRASATVRHLRWFEVVQTRGDIESGRVHRYQVTVRVGFVVEGTDQTP